MRAFLFLLPILLLSPMSVVAQGDRHSVIAAHEKLTLGSAGEIVMLKTLAKSPAKGSLLLLPDSNDAVTSAGPLLALRSLLAQAGWNVYVLMGRPQDPSQLQDWIQQAINGLPPPGKSDGDAARKMAAATVTNQATTKPDKAPVILLAQGDASAAVLQVLAKHPKAVQGLILLSAYTSADNTSKDDATAAPVQNSSMEPPATTLPVLDVMAEQDWQAALLAGRQRQQGWREHPRYRQDFIAHADHQFAGQELWLSHRIQGWLQAFARPDQP